MGETSLTKVQKNEQEQKEEAAKEVEDVEVEKERCESYYARI